MSVNKGGALKQMIIRLMKQLFFLLCAYMGPTSFLYIYILLKLASDIHVRHQVHVCSYMYEKFTS